MTLCGAACDPPPAAAPAFLDTGMAPPGALPHKPAPLTLPTCSSRETGLAAIVERGVLRVGLPNDTTSFFSWRGQILGFEFELLERFAADLGVTLEPVHIQGVQARYDALHMGRVDAIAGRLVRHDDPTVLYSAPIAEAQGVLLQRTRSAPATCAPLPITEEDIDSATVIVARHHGWPRAFEAHPHQPAFRPLPEGRPAETVSRRVRRGVGTGLVRDDLASLFTAGKTGVVDWPELDVQITVHVGFHQSSPELEDAFDAWLLDHLDALTALQVRYFEKREEHRERTLEPTFTVVTGQISPFDALFQDHARPPKLEWTLLAALAYQESRFDPRARSWAGARGLMQLMGPTARELGVSDPFDPEQAVDGAARYLLWLDTYWSREIADEDLRLRFVLASYNAGLGHLEDARRVAVARGGDDTSWPDIEEALLALESPRWYRSSSAKYGYVRGTEPVHYVTRILDRQARYAVLAERIDTGVGTQNQ